jgi:hypothetical protein
MSKPGTNRFGLDRELDANRMRFRFRMYGFDEIASVTVDQWQAICDRDDDDDRALGRRPPTEIEVARMVRRNG